MMNDYGRKPPTPSRQKARQRAGEPNPSLLNEGQRRWRKQVGIDALEAENARLQARVEEVEREREEAYQAQREMDAATLRARKERDGYKALAERREKALGHAIHLTEHNKANCARCREARKRICAAIEEEEPR